MARPRKNPLPKKGTEQKYVTIGIRITRDDYERFETVKEYARQSTSAIVYKMLMDFVREKETAILYEEQHRKFLKGEGPAPVKKE